MTWDFVKWFWIAFGLLLAVLIVLFYLALGVEILIRRVKRWRESRIEYPF